MSLNPGLAKDWTKSGQIYNYLHHSTVTQWRQPVAALRLGGESAKQWPSSRFAFNTSVATWLAGLAGSLYYTARKSCKTLQSNKRR